MIDDLVLNTYRNLFQEILKNYQLSEDLENLKINQGGDEADLSMEERDKNLILKLQGRDSFFIKKVREALQRIEDGSFGYCQDCGNTIELSRLKARPIATLCIACKEDEERMEQHILYHRRSHTSGKTFANNILDFSTQKTEESVSEEIRPKAPPVMRIV